MQRGFHLARNEINFSLENPVWITFITEDDMSTADGAVNAYQHLVDAGVPAIVGPRHLDAGKASLPDCTREWGRGFQFRVHGSRLE